MRNDEIKALKVDIPFYVQKIVNVMASQLTAMPKIVNYSVTFDTRYGWVASLKDNEEGMYFVYCDGHVNYKPAEDKLSAAAATTTD